MPLEHIAALFQHNLEQAVASGLSGKDAERAYFVWWNGIRNDSLTETKRT